MRAKHESRREPLPQNEVGMDPPPAPKRGFANFGEVEAALTAGYLASAVAGDGPAPEIDEPRATGGEVSGAPTADAAPRAAEIAALVAEVETLRRREQALEQERSRLRRENAALQSEIQRLLGAP